MGEGHVGTVLQVVLIVFLEFLHLLFAVGFLLVLESQKFFLHVFGILVFGNQGVSVHVGHFQAALFHYGGFGIDVDFAVAAVVAGEVKNVDAYQSKEQNGVADE